MGRQQSKEMADFLADRLLDTGDYEGLKAERGCVVARRKEAASLPNRPRTSRIFIHSEPISAKKLTDQVAQASEAGESSAHVLYKYPYGRGSLWRPHRMVEEYDGPGTYHATHPLANLDHFSQEFIDELIKFRWAEIWVHCLQGEFPLYYDPGNQSLTLFALDSVQGDYRREGHRRREEMPLTYHPRPIDDLKTFTVAPAKSGYPRSLDALLEGHSSHQAHTLLGKTDNPLIAGIIPLPEIPVADDNERKLRWMYAMLMAYHADPGMAIGLPLALQGMRERFAKQLTEYGLEGDHRFSLDVISETAEKMQRYHPSKVMVQGTTESGDGIVTFTFPGVSKKPHITKEEYTATLQAAGGQVLGSCDCPGFQSSARNGTPHCWHLGRATEIYQLHYRSLFQPPRSMR
ncbi:MAG: hypothetical protein V1735_04660 [Nanoarchaeota archaeon]